jgi:carboxyl-terminal processing protease
MLTTCLTNRAARQLTAIVIVLSVNAIALLCRADERLSLQELIEKKKWKVVGHVGNSLVVGDVLLNDLPAPAKELSATERLENFEILWEAIDQYYSFFSHKSIDWQKVKRDYLPRIKRARGCIAYYQVLSAMLDELQDAHARFWNFKVDRPRLYSPKVWIDQIEGHAVVTVVPNDSEAFVKGVRPGATITHVDGFPVATKIQQIRSSMPATPSDRYSIALAYRGLLDGQKNSVANVRYSLAGSKRFANVELRRTTTHLETAWPWRQLSMTYPMTEGKFLWTGVLPSGYGYIRIISFRGKEKIADEFDRALETLRNLPGLVIDIRDNCGGTGISQKRMIGRLITTKKVVGTSFLKNGPGHQDFKKFNPEISPCGDWQYTKPVVLLVNVFTESAAELFACRMQSAQRAILIGTTTRGNVTGDHVNVFLPCKLVARISTGCIANLEGRIIEVNGNAPDITCEQTIQDLIHGEDSILGRAIQTLRNARGEKADITGQSISGLRDSER